MHTSRTLQKRDEISCELYSESAPVAKIHAKTPKVVRGQRRRARWGWATDAVFLNTVLAAWTRSRATA